MAGPVPLVGNSGRDLVSGHGSEKLASEVMAGALARAEPELKIVRESPSANAISAATECAGSAGDARRDARRHAHHADRERRSVRGS